MINWILSFFRKNKTEKVKTKSYQGYNFTFYKNFSDVLNHLENEVISFLDECQIPHENVYLHDNRNGNGVSMYCNEPLLLKEFKSDSYNYSNGINGQAMIIPDFKYVPQGFDDTIIYRLIYINTFLHELCHYLNHTKKDSSHRNIPKFVKEYEAIIFSFKLMKKFNIPLQIYCYNIGLSDYMLDLYIDYINSQIPSNI